MPSGNVDHVGRARQIADALDSANPEQTLYEQFHAEWKAWEAEDATRTMRAFDRAIGRSEGYTARIVRGVTGETRAPQWGSGSNKRDEVARKVLGNPEQRREVIESLKPTEVDGLIADAHAVAVERAEARHAEKRDTPSAPKVGDLMDPADPFNPAEFWADTLVIRINRNAHELASLMRRAGGLLYGSMDPEKAYRYLLEAEGMIAEGRAAAQEQVQDKERV